MPSTAALVGLDAGDVTAPEPVGLLRIEAPLRLVRRHRQAALAVGRHHVLAFDLGANPALPHEFARPVFANPDSTGRQFFAHTRPAIFTLDLGIDGADERRQGFIAETARRPTLARLTPAQPVEKNRRLRPPAPRMTRSPGTAVSFGVSRRTLPRVLREERRGFFCNGTLHTKTRRLGAQTRNLHLLGCNLHRLAGDIPTVELALGGQPHPVAQAGLGDTRRLGRRHDSLPSLDPAIRLQFESCVYRARACFADVIP